MVSELDLKLAKQMDTVLGQLKVLLMVHCLVLKLENGMVDALGRNSAN